ncbi:MAG: LTA synthase family protein [Lachnospiraceae bacterium]|nr:LTA synthase family protein [Lachnospiraceae bacterium]
MDNDTLRTASSLLRKAYSVFILLLSPFIMFWCVEFLANNPMNVWTVSTIVFNILFYELFFLLLFFLTGRLKISLIAGDVFFLLFGLVNHFVMEFRSEPIVPWDIFSAGTAAGVASNYDYTLTPTVIGCISVTLLLLVLAVFAKLPVLRFRIRAVFLLLVVCSLSSYIYALHQDKFIKAMKFDNTLFTPWFMARKNGLTTAFLMDLRYLKVEQPEGYSKEAAEELIDDAGKTDSVPADRPNIIVIMNEAFSDPAVLGDFKTNQDYIPFFRTLYSGAGNTVSGMLNVSVKGGNTANTEYEFLTGNSMRYFPAGSIPYQQYMFGPKASIVKTMKEYGYTTIAMHPYIAKGWNRNHVYDYFGFDEKLFRDEFPDAEILRKYIDDRSVYSKIGDILEEKEDDDPAFIFAVTMQNHSGYFDDYDNFDVDVHAEDCGSRILDRYLSLMKQSDEALYEFIYALSDYEEDTVIIFFGDHQPNDVVVDPVLKLHGRSSSTLGEEEYLRYQVPFIIWANYDIEEKTGIDTSVNYLAAHLMETAGLPLSDFQEAMRSVEEEIPVISTKRLVDSEGHALSPEEESADEKIKAFRYLEYYRAFDEPASDEGAAAS